MKVFWSWQSDTEGKTGRFFVRSALNDAIKELKQAEDVEEPPEAARLEALHVDADREGVAGSPDLANLIKTKIKSSAVVIADITPVGKGPPRFDKNKKEIPPKDIMNPNVAIELGFAMGVLPEDSFLMVLNEHYGDRSSVPFDLAHKGGPIMYDLAPDARAEKIKEEHAKLRGKFVLALREFLKKPAPSEPVEPFVPTPSTANSAAFWQPGEALARFENDIARLMGKEEDVRELRFDESHAFYLRILPHAPLAAPLRHAKLESASQKRPRVLTPNASATNYRPNSYGMILYDTDDNKDINGFVQFFENGEVWAASKSFFRNVKGEILIPTISLEQIYVKTITAILPLMKVETGIVLPYKIIMGAVGLKDARLALGNRQESGPIFKPEVITECELKSYDENAVTEVVSAFLADVFNVGRVTRT